MPDGYSTKLTHDFRPRSFPLAVSNGTGVYEFGSIHLMQPRRKFQTRYRHGRCTLLERRERPVQINAQVPRRLPNIILIKAQRSRHLDHDLLWIPIPEVEAGGFEHEALEADDELGVVFEALHVHVSDLSLPKGRTMPTGSSLLSCSPTPTFKFQCAASISLLFFSVSSILHAVNSAAAAASA